MRKGAVVVAILVASVAAAAGWVMFQRSRAVIPSPDAPLPAQAPQTSSVESTLPPERFAGRLAIRTAQDDAPAHLYLNEVLQGRTPLAKEIFVEAGEYTARAVVPSDQPQGAFFVVGKKLVVGAGERREIELDIPPIPLDPDVRAEMPNLVPTCDAVLGSFLVGSPDDPDPVVPQFRALQKMESEIRQDDILSYAAAVEQAYRNAPPATASLLFPGTPVWSYDGEGSAMSWRLDIELDAGQVAHVGRWIERQRYGLHEFQEQVEETHYLLKNRHEWAAGCGHHDYARLLQPRVENAQRAIDYAQLLRKHLTARFNSITKSLEAAER